MGAARLEVVAGNAAGMSILVEDELLIGRHAKGAGRLADDDEISRSHARVSVDAGGFCAIEDLGSTNGTFVNGLRISAPQPLSEGDTIEIGATTLVVRELLPTETGPAPPTPGTTAPDLPTPAPTVPDLPTPAPTVPDPPAPAPAGPDLPTPAPTVPDLPTPAPTVLDLPTPAPLRPTVAEPAVDAAPEQQAREPTPEAPPEPPGEAEAPPEPPTETEAPPEPPTETEALPEPPPDAPAAPAPAAAPMLSVQLQIDFAACEARLSFDDASEPVRLVFDSGEWRPRPPD